MAGVLALVALAARGGIMGPPGIIGPPALGLMPRSLPRLTLSSEPAPPLQVAAPKPPPFTTKQLDRMILAQALPAALNFALFPLAGAVDVFWVSALGDATLLGGMGAANQVFSTCFFLVAFLPSVTTPFVAGAVGRGDVQAAQARVAEALQLATLLGLAGSLLVCLRPDLVLRLVAAPGTGIYEAALPYLAARGPSFLAAILSSVGFAAFRGHMDSLTPLKVYLVANSLNMLLDPVLIFGLGLGAKGAALATVAAECVSCIAFAWLLLRRGIVTVSGMQRLPGMAQTRHLLNAGLAVQARSASVQGSLLCVARRVTSMGDVAAAAHQLVLQFWSLGGVALLSLSTAAAVVIPARMGAGGPDAAQRAADRVLAWGALAGAIIGVLLLGLTPLVGRMSPAADVSAAALPVAAFAAFLQPAAGVIFAGEGVMQGQGCFGAISAITAVASIALLGALQLSTGLRGVWMALVVFNAVRLVGVGSHCFVWGPLAKGRRRRNAGHAAAERGAAL